MVDIPRYNVCLMETGGGYSVSPYPRDNNSLISTALVYGWREALQNVINNYQHKEDLNLCSQLFLLGPRYHSKISSLNKGIGDDCQFMMTGSVDTRKKPGESFRDAGLRELEEECGLRVTDDSKFSEVLESKIKTIKFVYHYNIAISTQESNRHFEHSI